MPVEIRQLLSNNNNNDDNNNNDNKNWEQKSYVTNAVGCDAGSFIETPVNTHHTLGSNKVIRLNCFAKFIDPNTNQLVWVGRATTEAITDNEVVSDMWRHKYEIQGDFDLVFKDPELSDAGKYECGTSDESTEPLQYSAQVIISGTNCTFLSHFLRIFVLPTDISTCDYIM